MNQWLFPDNTLRTCKLTDISHTIGSTIGSEMINRLTAILAAPFICASLIGITDAQAGQAAPHFVRDTNRPFVYLKFDHIGMGVRRHEHEPSSRIWFQFVNNCNVPIQLHAYSAPDGSLSEEVGVMDDVVADQPMLTITPATDIKTEDPFATVPKLEDRSINHQPDEMPVGYVGELGSTLMVAPGHSVLFSVPTNHLGSKEDDWHMEIPFWIDTPKGRGPRDPVIGGEPVMRLHYSFYDLPADVQAQITKRE